MSSVARPNPTPSRPPRNGQQRRGATRRNTVRPPSIPLLAEPLQAPAGLSDTTPPEVVASEASPTPHDALDAPPASEWRRWAFAASAVANLVFAFGVAAGVHLSYAPPSNRGQMPLLSALAALAFLGCLCAGLVANALLALGRLAQHYHLLLYTALGCAAYCEGLLGFAALATSLRLGYGILEPLSLWQLLAYQALALVSARKHPPLAPLQVRLPFLALQRMPLRQAAQTLMQAARAFKRALETGGTGSDTGSEE